MRGLESGLITFLIYFVSQATILHQVTVTRRASVLVGLWIAGLPVYASAYALMPDDQVIWPAPLVAPSDAVTWLTGGLLLYMRQAESLNPEEYFGK